MKIFLPALLTTYLFISAASAKKMTDSSVLKMREPIQKFYVGGATDGALFSMATINRTSSPLIGTGAGPASTNTMSRLRFSYVLNFGFSFNFNFGRHIGAFTGIDMKNIGFIENMNSTIVKRRTYNVGVPVAIKIGNMARKGMYVFLGGGADVPINYREKAFTIRDQKVKFNEWFSDRTPQIMPYVFVGVVLHKGVSLKAQYYPTNYLNPNYTTGGIKPYNGYDVHLMQLSLGYGLRYSKKHNTIKTKTTELKTM
ncbi:MAG: hypothetical protein JWQ38_3793 [Flavipsychrobacter sp.]|nr:hypothetical protein [Flavipsychrobacter sp.]